MIWEATAGKTVAPVVFQLSWPAHPGGQAWLNGGMKVCRRAAHIGTNEHRSGGRTTEEIRPERNNFKQGLQNGGVSKDARSGADHGLPVALDVPGHAKARRKYSGVLA